MKKNNKRYEAIASYALDHTADEIALHFGISKTEVYNLGRNHKMIFLRVRNSKVKLEKALKIKSDLKNTTKTLEQIGQEQSLTRQRIQQIARKFRLYKKVTRRKILNCRFVNDFSASEKFKSEIRKKTGNLK
jgi:predicted DNA-binding protein YlxM (UPF0122 family)